jgi:hypothetical protein
VVWPPTFAPFGAEPAVPRSGRDASRWSDFPRCSGRATAGQGPDESRW